MKVLYIVHQFYPEYQGGTEKFAFNIAFMTQKKGIKVKVVSYSFYDDSFFNSQQGAIVSKEFSYRGIPIIAFKRRSQPIDLHFSLTDDSTLEFAKTLLKQEAPDIIHICHTMRVHQFAIAAKELNIPYILTLTDFFLICPKIILAPSPNSLCSGPERGRACSLLCSELDGGFISQRLEIGKRILNNANAVVAPSNFLAKIFQNECQDLPMYVNPHGINYKNIEIIKKNYSNYSNLQFGFSGTLMPHKGVHILINAFTKIEDESIRLIIYGVGEPKYTLLLKEMASSDNRIAFRGEFTYNELPEIYKNFDIMIIPSTCYESFSFVLHESLASNIPVIGSRLGAIGDIVEDGVNGFTFEPGNSKDLQIKISKLIENPELINSFKENIRINSQISNIEQESYFYWKYYCNLLNNLEN